MTLLITLNTHLFKTSGEIICSKRRERFEETRAAVIFCSDIELEMICRVTPSRTRRTPLRYKKKWLRSFTDFHPQLVPASTATASPRTHALIVKTNPPRPITAPKAQTLRDSVFNHLRVGIVLVGVVNDAVGGSSHPRRRRSFAVTAKAGGSRGRAARAVAGGSRGAP